MLLDSPLCQFGWPAPEFSLNDTSGSSVSLSEQLTANGLLIAFICNHCPYVKAIIKRMVENMRELQDAGVNVIAIMPNDYLNYPDDSPDNMRLFAEQHKFSFPYLIDKDQQVAKAYDAVCTPDFFGFNRQGELQYRGRLDNVKMTANEGRDKELVNAMLQIAQTGQGPAQQVASMGCSIKWKS